MYNYEQGGNGSVFLLLNAIVGVAFTAVAIAALGGSAFSKFDQRIAYRNCLLTQSVEICTAARPLGAIK